MKRDTFRFPAGVLLPIGGLPLSVRMCAETVPAEAPDTPHMVDIDVRRARLTFCPAAERDALALAEARTELIRSEPVQTTG